MLPINAVSGSTLDSTIIYLAVIGMLLLVATVLRLKVPFFKKFYMPASLLAGLMGLILGPHFIGLIPEEMNSMFSALSGRLIVLVYAPMLMRKTKNEGQFGRRVASRAIWSYFNCFSQYSIPLILTVVLFTPIWGLNPLFGTIVEQGWAGGHGTAGGMALVFEELGWMDGASLSVTSATIGLFAGIVGGTVIINIGIRKGWTAYIGGGSVKGLENNDPEIYSADTAKSAAAHVTSSNVIDSISYHLAIISVAIFFGWIANVLLKQFTGFSVAWYVTSMFVGLLIKLLIKKTKYYDAIDNGIINRIQGVSLDFLIVAAVSSVNVPVVISYLTPLLIQQLIAFATVLWIMLWVAPRVFPKNWFEQSMYSYGTMTGVAAVGLMLLRMTDPNLKSDVLEVNAYASPFTSWAVGGGIITSVMPSLIVKYGVIAVTGATFGLFILCFAILRIFFWLPNGKDYTAAGRQEVNYEDN